MTYIIEMALPFLFFSPFASHRVFAAFAQVKKEFLARSCCRDAGDDVQLLVGEENAYKVVVVGEQ